ncbi:probable RNA-binding protein CG14230 isoform X1 [Microplitis demolitor]|uniref:probable RNA-binding protein CG14230 isoform X1 n=1 Tax=Microplitis demolitor TaxID=69319 RepID=UPI0004CD58E1|nr:probable RNA-binding protein CG14230 isoform X1 [Microplitis demolitor]
MEPFKIDADSKQSNNKIIFSDDESGNKREKRKLFDDDDDDDECVYDISEKKRSKKKVIGNDERFTIDKKHLDDEEKEEEPVEEQEDEAFDEDDLVHEKKKELEILGQILGKPVLPKPEIVAAKKTKTMERYDPTGDDHHKHEIKIKTKESETTKKSKKKKKEIQEEEKINEEPPPPVNEEIFYSVSDKLTESLQKKEEFSLLKAFGSNVPVEDANNEVAKATELKPLKVKYNIKTKNPFKYDSSDDEDDSNKKKNNKKLTSEFNNNKFVKTNNFFFASNDSRFKDAIEFFNTPSSSNESFKDTRRELKQIVRSKIRNNVRKNRPWRTKVLRVKSKK